MNQDPNCVEVPRLFDERERKTRLDEIWSTDLLNRRQEADELEMYLSQRLARVQDEGADGAFTISVDAPYGEGKSFFLTKLSQQLLIRHPVAFINAWSDDTADQPLTALFVAIEDALRARERDPAGPGWDKLRKNSTKLLALAGKAGIKGLAARVFTKEGVEDLKDAASDLVDDVYERWADEEANTFRQRRDSIKEFKDSLNERLDEIEGMGVIVRPAFIIIDELDRCRPTYAIRMLEEIKHLFDNTGIVFILGTSRSALLPSIKAVYGSEFGANEYLHRFIKRTYKLDTPSLTSIVRKSFSQTTVDLEQLALSGVDPAEIDQRLTYFADYIASVMRGNRRTARDVGQVMEYVYSFMAIWPHDQKVQLGYLLPLIINHHYDSALAAASFQFPIHTTNGVSDFGYDAFFQTFQNRAKWTFRKIMEYQAWSPQEHYVRNLLVQESQQRGTNTFRMGGNSQDDPSNKLPWLSEYNARVNRVARLIN